MNMPRPRGVFEQTFTTGTFRTGGETAALRRLDCSLNGTLNSRIEIHSERPRAVRIKVLKPLPAGFVPTHTPEGHGSP